MNVIFIHGLGQSEESWNQTTAELPDYLTPHCPGLTALCTGKGKKMTYENLYCTFEQYCNNSSQPLHLCGISLGAVLAVNYTIYHKEKVKSLVLIAPQYKMPRLLLKLQNIIFNFMPDSSFQKIGITKSDLIQLTDSMTNLDFSRQLQDITCTSLIICGSKDTANKKAAKYMADSLPAAQIRMIKNAGHEINVEAPKTLTEILTSFYSSDTLRSFIL